MVHKVKSQTLEKRKRLCNPETFDTAVRKLLSSGRKDRMQYKQRAPGQTGTINIGTARRFSLPHGHRIMHECGDKAGIVQTGRDRNLSGISPVGAFFYEQTVRAAMESTSRGALGKALAIYTAGEDYAKDSEALKLFEQASAEGNAKADYYLGQMYEKAQGTEQDFDKAFECYSKAADAGDSDAVFSIGLQHYYGHHVPQSYREALRWFMKAAEMGNAKGWFNAGVMYEQGLGTDSDIRKAIDCYTRSSELGYDKADYNLGMLYRTGKGVEKDDAEAFRWFMKAAELGMTKGIFNVGLSYYRGQGVPQSDSEAMKWFMKGAELGHTKSENMVKILRNEHKIISIGLS